MEFQQALRYVGKPEPFDVETYREAGLALVQNRDKLNYRVFYKIPDPDVPVPNLDQRWDEIRAGSTGERCECGNCRTIWPAKWPEFEEKEVVTLRKGEGVYIVPEGGTFLDTLVHLQVVEDDEGDLCFTVEDDPFSDTVNFASILRGLKGFSLPQLVNVMAKEDAPAPLCKKFPEGANAGAEKMTLCSLHSATTEEVLIGIGKGYVASRDPEKEFPV